MDVGFDPEHAEVASVRTKAKLKHLGSGTLQTARHRAWVMRGKAMTANAPTWRPAALHRVSTKRWLSNIDNAMQRTTCLKATGFRAALKLRFKSEA